MNATISRSLTAAGCLAVLLTTACRPAAPEAPMTSIPTVTEAQWQAAAARRVIFAHQSVGRDLLDGLRSLDGGSRLAIAETRAPGPGPGLFHFPVGRNGDPFGKVGDFAAAVDAAAPVDIALVKLCYVDLPAAIDPLAVARAYGDTLDALAARHPTTTFVAVTMPLTTVQEGRRAFVKKLLGRAPTGLAENARRQAFNDVLRSRSRPDRPLFDLAAVEAAGRTARHHGREIQYLDPALTSDGAHLNDEGARRAAAALVAFLAGLEVAPATP
ncbi:hypothetical protein FJ250_03265 [bacterium]|nr:hypothetical protein [bacterium]